MRPVLILAGGVLVASACSLMVKFDSEGQSCGAGGECLPGYVCVDGACRRGTDGGYAIFEALLSSSQVDPPTGQPSVGSGRFVYDYAANTLHWSIDHDAGEAVAAALYVGHPGWTATDPWKGLGSAQSPITGSMSVTDAGSLLEDLTRGHIYVALKNYYGYELIRGYIVEPDAGIYVTAIYTFDPTYVLTLVARAGFVVSPDAGTLYYDVTTEGQTFSEGHIHDWSTHSTLVNTPLDPSAIRSSGAVSLPSGVLPLLDTRDQTYYELHPEGQTATASGLQGNIRKVK
jgi:hypothetical protein